MLGYGWLTVRQVQEALRQGRLDEALRLLGQPAAQGHRRTEELRRQLALALIDRADRHLGRDDSESAWQDLVRAESLAVTDPRVEKLRQTLTRLGLAQVRALLEAGQPQRANEAIGVLRDRAVRAPELQPLEEAAREWWRCAELADRGEFAQSRHGVERLRRLLAAPAGLDRFAAELSARQGRFEEVVLALHEALDRRQWREVVRQAEAVLAVAPHNSDARKARSQAWKAIEPATIADPSPAADAPPPRPAGAERFLLWIDGVGGYLVCLGQRVTLGQATPDSPADVPVYADLSRLHAALTRDAEGYLLEPLRPAAVNGKPLAGATLLRPGDLMTLGGACQVRFAQPAPVSATARLEVTSGNRLPLAVDGVLLMADTLILGPGTHVHVVVPDLPQPVILYRHKEGLGVRWVGEFTVDGQRHKDRALLPAGATTLMGAALTMTIEPASL
jgi:hypothetical protein